MDLNKLKETQKLHYSKKETQLIYWQAQAKDIKKKELKDIKKALYEIIDLGQHSSDFIKLLKILKILPDNALKNIESGEFTKIYNKLADINNKELGAFYKGSFQHCNNLLLLLYTDYSNINSIQEFELVSTAFYLQIYINGNPEITNMIFNINPSLSYLLEYYKEFKEKTNMKKFEFFYHSTLTTIEKILYHLEVTLLMHIDEFNYQYNLPTEIALYLYENIETTHNTIIPSYNTSKNKYQFCITLLQEYINLKNNNSSIKKLNQKTKKLLSNEK